MTSVGVDPYIERAGLWPDFHVRFINYLCEAVAEALPSGYEARMDERVNLVELSPHTLKRMEPDLAVTHGGTSVARSTAATVEPTVIPLLIEEERREVYIEIVRRPNRSLVAVVELLSPANKAEPGRSLYLAKRNALLRQPIHLVELDLLASGRRLPMGADYPSGDYFALVSRAEARPNCEVYAWAAGRPLPAIPLPLHVPDPDCIVDLESVFRTAFLKGQYARSDDYRAASGA